RVLDSNQLGVPLFEHTVLADVDGDGLPEHIVGYGNLVNALKHDGSQAAGWPQNVAPNNESLGLVFEAPAVGDVDGDGAPEVVAATLDGRIWVWEGDGVLKAGWPQQRNEFDRNNVTLADVDGDDTLEIVLAEDEDGLDVIRSDGSSLPGFPVNPGSDLSGGVTVADLDGDGDAEIVGALADFGGPYVLFAYDHTGQPLPGFPLTVGDAAKRPSFPVVGDLDDDGDLEI